MYLMNVSSVVGATARATVVASAPLPQVDHFFLTEQ
jgi:hypothetical protein